MRVAEIRLQSSKDSMCAKVRVVNKVGEGIPDIKITGFWLRPQSKKEKSNKDTKTTDQHGWAIFQMRATCIGAYTFEIQQVNKIQIDNFLSSLASATKMYRPMRQMRCQRYTLLQERPASIFELKIVDGDGKPVKCMSIFSRWEYPDKHYENHLLRSDSNGTTIVKLPQVIPASNQQGSVRLTSLSSDILHIKEVRFVIERDNSNMVDAFITISDDNLSSMSEVLVTYTLSYPSGKITQQTISTNSSGQACIHGVHEKVARTLKITHLKKPPYKYNLDDLYIESSYVPTPRKQPTLTIGTTHLVAADDSASPLLEASILVLNEKSAEFLDEKELAISNAQVEVIWYGPSGEIRPQRRRTDLEGVSRFTMKPSSSGTWELSIIAIHKEGYESLHSQKELTCQVVLEEKAQTQPDRSSSIQVETFLGIMKPPGITIKDKLILNGTRAELMGELYVEAKVESRQRISGAQVAGFWTDPDGTRKNISGKTDSKGKFTSSILTSGAGRYKLVIRSIEKQDYKLQPISLHKSWNGTPSLTVLSPDSDFDKKKSILKKRYNYSVAQNVPLDIRHSALKRAVEDEDGLGLAYVVRFLTQLNRYHKNNPKHANAIERRRDDIRWLKITYYDKLTIKHFIFPPI